MGDVESLSQMYQEATRSFSDKFKMGDGENEVRILPRSFEGTKWGQSGCTEKDPIAFITHTHFNLVQADGSKTAKGCPRDEGNYCALHDLSESLLKSSISAEKKLGESIRAQRRFSMNLLNMEDLSKGIQAFETGPGVMQEIVKFVNKRYGMLVGLKDGRNLFVTRIPKEKTGTGFPTYTAQPDPNVSDITDKLPEGWEEKLDELKKNLRPTPSSAEIIELVKSLRPQFAFPNKPAELGRAPEEKKETVSTSEPTKSQESDQGLKCFGKEFSPKSEKCKACESRLPCKVAFLEE